MQITTTTAKASGASIPFGTLVQTPSGRTARTVSDTRTTTNPDGSLTTRTNLIQFAADDPHAPNTVGKWLTNQLTVIPETTKTLRLIDCYGYDVCSVTVPLADIESATQRLLTESAPRAAVERTMWSDNPDDAHDPRFYRVV